MSDSPLPARVDFVSIEDEMQRAYIDYSMSVIIGRALPDVRDGLKPGNRRILYAMRERGWTAGKPFVKCAKVVGEVIGNFHPHGDSAVYDTMVRMGQDFSMRYPFIDGQGNFGSLDGDPPAAYRYTECRLHRAAEEMLADIQKDTVDVQPNFDETLTEPRVLPARIPNLLVNGSTGIAVGMATNIPPHNLREVVDACIHLIDHPEATVGDLMHFVRGPDFPTGGQVLGLDPVRSMYETGRGAMKLRGKAHVEEDANRIIITEIPYALNKATLQEKIAELVQDKRLEGIRDLRDESNKKGIRVVVELKQGAIADVVLNNLFKQTPLETTFGAIMLAVDHGRPKVMNLRELLQAYVAHRLEGLTRRTEFDLAKARERAHILEGYLIALDHLDEVVRVIRESRDRDVARAELVARFGLTEVQAQAILELRLYQLTGLEREKIEEEYREIRQTIEYLEGLLADEGLRYGVVKDELHAVREKYGDDRRTELLPHAGDLAIEDLIEDAPCVLTLSHAGYIKRMAMDAIREQRRGGKGVVGAATRDEDFVESVFTASAHDTLLFFTAAGRVYKKRVYEVPEASRTAKGKALVNFLDLNPDEKIAALIRTRDFPEDRSLVFATEHGTVKRSSFAAFRNILARGIIAIAIDEGDRLIAVRETTGEDEVMLVTRKGMSVRFHEDQLREQGRNTRGVRGIRLKGEDDAVEALVVVDPSLTLLTVTENGYGKRTVFSEYRTQRRGGQGIIDIVTAGRNGPVVAACRVDDSDSLMLVTQAGQMTRIPVDGIRVVGRNTQGVRLISLREGDRLVSVSAIEAEAEEESVESTGAPDGVEGSDPSDVSDSSDG